MKTRTNGPLVVAGQIAVDGKKFPALRRALERGLALQSNPRPAACATGLLKPETEATMTTKTAAKKVKKSKVAKAAGAKQVKAKASKERDPRIPAPGSVIEREYKNRKLSIKVLESGFEFEGETYSSLSALAKKVTGAASINGLLFFKLTTPKPVEAKK